MEASEMGFGIDRQQLKAKRCQTHRLLAPENAIQRWRLGKCLGQRLSGNPEDDNAEDDYDKDDDAEILIDIKSLQQGFFGHFQDMAPDERTDGKTDGTMDRQRQNKIPPSMAGDY
ncbi:hypothetical protein DPMN_113261 [Dreissena polymorpha]|uniref:Uncharacterized protein n=1 Tax=Dreissena polymorpha TaxID=45954 RepID=A0A9D4KI41_DREPO|nr:hypothetical protein DPMN_113261 [Dreissena polymorpha]